MYFVCVHDPDDPTEKPGGHLDRALALVQADMRERKLYQVACPHYANPDELGRARDSRLGSVLYSSSTGIIERVDVVNEKDETVLRRPVVRNQAYIKRIMEYRESAKTDDADEAEPDAVDKPSVDQLVEVTKLTKRASLKPASKLIARPPPKRRRPDLNWSQNKHRRKGERARSQPTPP